MRRTVLASLTLAALVATPIAANAKRPSPPPPPPEAGPAVSYTDQTGDAHDEDLVLTVGNPLSSNPALDIVGVGFAPVPHTKQRVGGYTTSITLAGAATAEGNYVSAGRFANGTEDCQLYHFLAPRMNRAYANAWCGTKETGTRRLVGQVYGGPVSQVVDGSGRTTLTAQFDNRSLPALLEAADRTLSPLFAFTCFKPAGSVGEVGCDEGFVDEANGSLSYRL